MLREVAEYPNCFGPPRAGRGADRDGRATPLCLGPGLDLEHGSAAVLPAGGARRRARGGARASARARANADAVGGRLVGAGRPGRRAAQPRRAAPTRTRTRSPLVLTREPPAIRAGFPPRARVETMEELEGRLRSPVGGVRAPRRRRSPRRRPCYRRSFRESETLAPRGLARRRDRLPPAPRRRPSTACCSNGRRDPRSEPRGPRRLSRADSGRAGTTRSSSAPPALITQGGSMSRPILERLGFERIGEVHMLLDVLED